MASIDSTIGRLTNQLGDQPADSPRLGRPRLAGAIARPLIALATLAIGATGCGVIPGTNTTTIEPGYAGLKIQLYGGEKGIDNAELVTGRVWHNGYTEEVVVFPVFVNTYPFTQTETEGSLNDESIVFSVGGSPVSADVGLSFGFSTEAIDGGPRTRLHDYYKTYRKDPDQFRANELRNGLRNCFSEVAETKELTPSMLPTNQQRLVTGVRDCMQKRFPIVVIQDVSLLSPLRLPPDIQASINEQFAAQQAAQTAEANRRKVEAEAAANVARAKGEAQVTIERAKAEAEANRLRSGSITPQVLEFERLKVEQARIQKWNGQQAPNIQTPNVQLGTPATSTAPSQ
ncbi:MAG: SPFH domain-containing protein [Cyanobacteria bacterium P01_D01_bin.73]